MYAWLRRNFAGPIFAWRKPQHAWDRGGFLRTGSEREGLIHGVKSERISEAVRDKRESAEASATEVRMGQLKRQAVLINEEARHIPTGEKYREQFVRWKERLMRHFDIGEGEWSDWRWQIRNRISDVRKLSDIFMCGSEKIDAIGKVETKYPWNVSPFYLSLIGDDIDRSPLARICLPDPAELSDSRGMPDPMNEAALRPAGCITRRYPDRLILNVTNECGSYCRFCQRKRNIRVSPGMTPINVLEQSFRYIRENTEIRDVLITGGDPLTLEDEALRWILESVRSIRHVEMLRIGTRMPVYVPMRITEALCAILKKYNPLYINVHINHPLEINDESRKALEKLADAGIPVSNQMVLLNGVNSDPYTVLVLNRELLKARVRPYYIFHPKAVKGAMHYQCSIDQGLKIMDFLRGRLSGLGIPTYVVNCNGGWGKVPLLPDYLLDYDDDSVALRTWEDRVVRMDL
jgi:glutamate 2,3-aminomutase